MTDKAAITQANARTAVEAAKAGVKAMAAATGKSSSGVRS